MTKLKNQIRGVKAAMTKTNGDILALKAARAMAVGRSDIEEALFYQQTKHSTLKAKLYELQRKNNEA